MKKRFFNISFIFLAVLFLIGFFFRVKGLKDNYSFWTDEASTARFARGVLQTGISQIPLTGHKESSYHPTVYLTAFSMSLLGENEFSARLPQVLAGTILIIAVFFLGKEMFNALVGLGASVFTAFSYILIAWSRQARGYSLLVLFFILAIYFLFRFLKKEKTKELLLALLFLLLAVFTHTLGIILVPVFFLNLVIAKKNSRIFQIKYLPVLILAVFFLLFFSNLRPTLGLLVNQKIQRVIFEKEFYLSYFHSLFWRQYSLFSFLSLFSLIYLYLKGGKEKGKQFILLFSLLVIYLFSASFLLYVPFEKYVLPLFPLFFLLASYSLFEISGLLGKNSTAKNILFFFFVFFIVINGNKFSVKPKSFYSMNFDMREIPEIDYKINYSFIGEKMTRFGKNNCAIIDIDEEIPAWYLGEGIDGFIPRKEADQSLNRNPLTNYRFIRSLDDFLKVKNDYQCGFLTLVEHNFRFYPDGLIEEARNNLFLEKKEQKAFYSPDWNYWSFEIYSWGFEK